LWSPPRSKSKSKSNRPFHHRFVPDTGTIHTKLRPFSSTPAAADNTDGKANGDGDSDGDGDGDENIGVPPELLEPRESMAFDILIVGGGPAGLAAAIRAKQLCLEHDQELSVCVIDKGSEIGAHVLSGNVFDPKAICELFPQWAKEGGDADGDGDEDEDNPHWTKVFFDSQGSHATPVKDDHFQILTEGGSSYSIPGMLLPSQLHNDGNYILSLSQLCRWLAEEAEALGVEIYPGFAASEVLLSEDDDSDSYSDTDTDTNSDGNEPCVLGIATRDVGIGKDGSPKATFERGVELRARQTLFAEGARGSCSEFLMEKLGLRDDDSVQPQTYGLGIKEVWEVPEETFQKGLVQHTLGFPLQSSPTDDVFGGSFVYHQEPNLVLAGLVVGLDYKNPYLNPYKEFQKWKTHPEVRKHFEGGTCISYGARVLNEGACSGAGFRSVSFCFVLFVECLKPTDSFSQFFFLI